METDPWGHEDPPAATAAGVPLPERLAALAALTEAVRVEPFLPCRFPSPDELPEVAALRADGWRPWDEAPWWFGLPTVWPRENRTWVPDRLPRVSVRTSGAYDTAGWVMPWDDGVRGDLHDDELEAARELLAMTEAELWDTATGPEAQAARAWRAEGVTGEDATDAVVLALTPQDLSRLEDPPPSGGGLTRSQALVWCRLVDALGEEAWEAVLGWRGLGLPPDPPEQSDLGERGPHDAEPWLAEGFSLTDAVALQGLPLARAIAWRDAGYGVPDVCQLLVADPSLTPDEAGAFAAAGVPGAEVPRWVEAGFAAEAARSWGDQGIGPQVARVWRSVALGPDDAARHLAATRESGREDEPGGALPPLSGPLGWTSMTTDTSDRRYGVQDPPGTRGSQAAECSWHEEGGR